MAPSGASFSIERGPLDLDAVYVRAPPAGGRHPSRVTAWAPRTEPETSAFVANVSDGWYTMFFALTRHLPGEHTLVRSSLVDYQIADFHTWVEGKDARVVMALQDPKWTFFTKGEPRDFEIEANYAKRRIADRMNRGILVEYLRRQGWDLEDPAFWETERPAVQIAKPR